ncbi:protein monoglycylase TTLL8 [Budorcas taxicolor]|uniref:protein monoglycylase TTLL8 n=1 Tax=Budorcas taxicolor TaxID=37181 RepID=UPI002284FFBA|nr:protein monoglycylase TTLL8 [Budorcas taxicolor]
MLRAPRPGPHPGRGRVSDCSPRPERRLGALNRGLRDPTPPTPTARRRARSRPRRRPRRTPPPRRPRSPTPRAGSGAPPVRLRRWRPRAAQCAAPLGSVARGNRRTRDSATGAGGTQTAPGAQVVEGSKDEVVEGSKDEVPEAKVEAGMEPELKQGVCQDLVSSPRLDRLKIAKQLTDKAIKEKKIFSICGHYPVIRTTLRRKGWVEKKFHFLTNLVPSVDGDGEAVPENKRAEGKENQDVALEKADDVHDVMSRLVKNETPYFLWTIKRDVIDYHSLSCDQMLNHYGKTASFTTKIGLCVSMRSLPWYVQANPDTFFPRCYSLCTESEKQEFLDDFRRTVASSILKWVVSQQSSRSKPRSRREEARHCGASRKVPEGAGPRLMGLSGQFVDVACKVCKAYLGRLEHEDIDLAEDSTRDLTEDEWNDLIQQYYSLTHGEAFIPSSRNHFSQCQALLNKITSVNPQTEIDGLRNIWIIKPAAKSRGRDIVCMNHVEEILELVAADQPPAKDNKWVVQKYIETPLLIYDTKFDIRQWFLVTDWNPLTIWFYKESYLRFSTQRFSLDKLDSAIHLCNNSIQKHLKNDKDRSPLLPCHNMWTSTRFQEYLQKRGRGAVWSSVIYPSMKRAITNTMKVAQGHVEPRKNSFELYGADFILGRDFRPWLIEINSSPTMHASTPVTAQLCAQVQEDTIKVVVDRKADRNCDIGNFELLWKQPAVELPTFQGSDLLVEGVGIRKARKQMPVTPSFDFVPPLSDIHPLKQRCPSAMLDLARGPPPMALHQELNLKDGKVPPCTLPVHLHRLVERSAKAKSGHRASGRKVELPSCTSQHSDSKAPRPALAKAESDRRSDPDSLHVHPLPSVLPSVKTAEGAPFQPPRPPGCQDNGGLLQQFRGPLNTKCPAQDQLDRKLSGAAFLLLPHPPSCAGQLAHAQYTRESPPRITSSRHEEPVLSELAGPSEATSSLTRFPHSVSSLAPRPVSPAPWQLTSP